MAIRRVKARKHVAHRSFYPVSDITDKLALSFVRNDHDENLIPALSRASVT